MSVYSIVWKENGDREGVVSSLSDYEGVNLDIRGIRALSSTDIGCLLQVVRDSGKESKKVTIQVGNKRSEKILRAMFIHEIASLEFSPLNEDSSSGIALR